LTFRKRLKYLKQIKPRTQKAKNIMKVDSQLACPSIIIEKVKRKMLAMDNKQGH
jgi:hypothetical protein